MITLEKAFETVMASCRRAEPEVISFLISAGRILAEDVRSDIDMPPFNRAAVDGYACRREDIQASLEVTEIIRAGQEPALKAGKNQCAKIMTGAVVPEGYDLVFMIEDSKITEDGKIIYTGSGIKANISLRGEDVKAGDIVIRAGKMINPQDIAVMASVGHTSVMVSRKPTVGIISTGDEIVEPDVKPSPASIRNSNSYQLLAQTERAGASGKYYGIAPDREDATFDMIRAAIAENDIVILTGGVSMGDFDFVPSVLRQAGVEILFDRINVQPGRPTTFGIHPLAVVFGLPGNPVSSFIQFETLVRPLIYSMMGYDWKPVIRIMPLGKTFERKSSVNVAWVPVSITEENEAVPVEYHGSAHITAFPYTDGIIMVAAGINIIEKGETVKVRQI